MSAELDALDRGIIEAGVTAAEALARVAALEVKVEALSETHLAAFRAGWELGLRRGRSGDPDSTPPAIRHLVVVQR